MKNFGENIFNAGAEVRPEKEMSAKEVYELASAKKIEYEKEIAADMENMETRNLLDKLVASFPSNLKDTMMDDAKRWFGYQEKGKLGKADINREVEIQAKRVRESYIDGFGMLNGEYGKMVIMNEIDRLLDNEKKSAENLKRIAMVNMDLNGLKAVNDLNDHSVGNEYLNLAVDVLNSRELTVWADTRRLKIIPIHDSGDEFSLIVVGEELVKDGDLEELAAMVEKEVYGKREAAQLVDLNDDKVLYKLYEIEAKSAGEPAEKPSAGLFTRLRAEIPEGFEFRAAISSGAINLYHALDMDKTGKNSVKKSDGYEKVLAKMMGSLKTVSDEKMGEKKNAGKEKLSIDPDPRKKMLARIYNIREAGAMKMKQKKEAAEKALSAEEEKKQTALKMRKAGMSAEEIIKFLLG
ncbi:MAG: hypothetical protein PHO56_03830 [Patescibacteria group bacterium]|nr:hypothetical protein [Patescibacteria group bacterium]